LPADVRSVPELNAAKDDTVSIQLWASQLESGQWNVNAVDSMGVTPLHVAVRYVHDMHLGDLLWDNIWPEKYDGCHFINFEIWVN